MEWKLWLDDQIHDPETPSRHCPDGHFAAPSSAGAMRLCLIAGPPAFMDLDHDLGMINTATGPVEDKAIHFLKWLFATYPNHPPEYTIHSANPVGRLNIESFMESWKRSLAPRA